MCGDMMLIDTLSGNGWRNMAFLCLIIAIVSISLTHFETVETPCVDGNGNPNMEGLMCEKNIFASWVDGTLFIVGGLFPTIGAAFCVIFTVMKWEE